MTLSSAAVARIECRSRLWSRERITGLTDWNGIYRGSRAIDLGQCRRYLAALYSPEWSEQLRSLYESIAGVTLDPWWTCMPCCTMTTASRSGSVARSLGAIPSMCPA